MDLNYRRWMIALAAVLIQLCLGTVYAWSVFKNPLMATHGFSELATQFAFMLNIAFLGIGSFAFGGLVKKKGPRFVAFWGGIFFAGGMMIAGLGDSLGNIYVIWLGYGLIAGIGNGLGYITPIDILIKWFPDKRGLITGIAVMGFGMGAFFMGQIAPSLIVKIGVGQTWLYSGFVFLAVSLISVQFYKLPPAGWQPKGFNPLSLKNKTVEKCFTFKEAVSKPQFYVLWTLLFLNITAGIGLISQLSPLAQDIAKGTTGNLIELAAIGGFIVAISSLFNGLGRPFWSWISDKIGRKQVFIILFSSQATLYFLLPQINNIILFGIVACYLLSTYGGGFSTMPAFAADTFGPTNMGQIYGAVLTAWSVAAIVGPFVFSSLKEYALIIAASLLICGLVITILFRKSKEAKGME